MSDGAPGQSDASRGPRVLRVSELVAALRDAVESAVGRVWVVGEVSNLRRAASGHCAPPAIHSLIQWICSVVN